MRNWNGRSEAGQAERNSGKTKTGLEEWKTGEGGRTAKEGVGLSGGDEGALDTVRANDAGQEVRGDGGGERGSGRAEIETVERGQDRKNGMRFRGKQGREKRDQRKMGEEAGRENTAYTPAAGRSPEVVSSHCLSLFGSAIIRVG